MKKIYVIFIASALMLTGCSDKPDKESESSSDMSAAVVTKVSDEGVENGSEDKKDYETLLGTSKKEYIVKSTTTVVDFEEKSGHVTTVPAENKNHGNASSGYAKQEELPVMNDEGQKSKSEVTTATFESSKVHTTSTTTAVTKDDVIELPFVPAE